MCDKERMVQENMGLAAACAGRFRGRGIEYDDLFQAGCMGLVKAVEGFDPDRGFRFSTYAVPYILGEIRRLFREGGSVKVSRSLRQLSGKVAAERERLTSENGREPSIQELADSLGLSILQVSEAVSAAFAPVSLSAGSEEGEQGPEIPVEPPQQKLTELLSLRSELQALPSADRKLLQLRFFDRKSQTETAGLLGMTQVQVSRRERKLLQYLRERLAG